MTPAAVLPVPMAPIMLSPPPALTSVPGLRPSCCAVADDNVPAGWSLEINGGNFPANSGSIALITASDQRRFFTSSNAVPLASPYSITARPVSQKFK